MTPDAYAGMVQLLARLPEPVRERMVRMYVQALDTQVAALQEALAAQDWKRAEQLAHKLAGSAGMMQDAELSRAGRVIENAIRDGVEEEAVANWPALEAQARQTRQAMRETYPDWC